MAAGRKSSASKIATIAVVIPLLIATWWCLDFFVPFWRYRHLDFAKLAAETKQPQASLERQYTFTVVYNPRDGLGEQGGRDPLPWQIVRMDPSWDSVVADPQDEDGASTLVRVCLINDRTGKPPGRLQLASGHFSDRYYTFRGWRLPPRAMPVQPAGIKPTRPIVIIDGFPHEMAVATSWKKLDFGSSEMLQLDVFKSGGWQNDDLDRFRDDGWEPPKLAEETP
jgi:hypothetical protein